MHVKEGVWQVNAGREGANWNGGALVGEGGRRGRGWKEKERDHTENMQKGRFGVYGGLGIHV